MPSLVNLEEDIVIKAAILCTAGHYSLNLSDFKLESPKKFFTVQHIIWAIEALQKKYPRYLQYAKWVAIKQAVDLIEDKRRGYRKKDDPNRRFTAPEMSPPPDMGKLMQEEWDRRFGRYYKLKRSLEVESELARFLRELNKMAETEVRHEEQSPDKPAKAITVDIDGKGIFVDMAPDEYAMWKTLTKRKPPTDKPTHEKDDPSP